MNKRIFNLLLLQLALTASTGFVPPAFAGEDSEWRARVNRKKAEIRESIDSISNGFAARNAEINERVKATFKIVSSPIGRPPQEERDRLISEANDQWHKEAMGLLNELKSQVEGVQHEIAELLSADLAPFEYLRELRVHLGIKVPHIIEQSQIVTDALGTPRLYSWRLVWQAGVKDRIQISELSVADMLARSNLQNGINWYRAIAQEIIAIKSLMENETRRTSSDAEDRLRRLRETGRLDEFNKFNFDEFYGPYHEVQVARVNSLIEHMINAAAKEMISEKEFEELFRSLERDVINARLRYYNVFPEERNKWAFGKSDVVHRVQSSEVSLIYTGIRKLDTAKGEIARRKDKQGCSQTIKGATPPS